MSPSASSAPASTTPPAGDGGDIDQYVETELEVGEAEVRRQRMLARRAGCLGERKIDLVVKTPDAGLPIHSVARRTGVVL